MTCDDCGRQTPRAGRCKQCALHERYTPSDDSDAPAPTSSRYECTACGAHYRTDGSDPCPECGSQRRRFAGELRADGSGDSVTGLAEFGIVSRTPVRIVATNADGDAICSECGTPVGGTRGPQLVTRPDLVDDELADRVGNTLPIYGWRCPTHHDDVVLALGCDPNADRIGSYVTRDSIDGWTGVRLRVADQSVHYVAVPRREVQR